MQSGENIDQLYTLFSDLLDKKLNELKVQADKVDKANDDDIQDDYMAEMVSFEYNFGLKNRQGGMV